MDELRTALAELAADGTPPVQADQAEVTWRRGRRRRAMTRVTLPLLVLVLVSGAVGLDRVGGHPRPATPLSPSSGFEPFDPARFTGDADLRLDGSPAVLQAGVTGGRRWRLVAYRSAERGDRNRGVHLVLERLGGPSTATWTGIEGSTALYSSAADGFGSMVAVFGTAPASAARVEVHARGRAPAVAPALAAGPGFPGRFFIAWLRAGDEYGWTTARDRGGRTLESNAEISSHVSPAGRDDPRPPATVAPAGAPVLLTVQSSFGQLSLRVWREHGGPCVEARSARALSARCAGPPPAPVRPEPKDILDVQSTCWSVGPDVRRLRSLSLALGAVPGEAALIRYEFADGRRVDVPTQRGGPDPTVAYYLAELPKGVPGRTVTVHDARGRVLHQAPIGPAATCR
jgi:hypothetical protein